MIRVLVTLAFLTALAGAGPAAAIERNFAGSAQLDYHFVPGKKSGSPRNVFDGFTSEVALKLAVDVSERLSANVKVCHGCHGFELPMAYFDYRVADELYVRVGRFSPSFGAFNLRHDPANHATSDKPLPYDMGRMLRKDQWNLGVLPSPFPDNGVEIGGTHWFGEAAQVDYAAYAVAGFRNARGSIDLDFSQSLSRSTGGFLVDNNGRPTAGARAAFTVRTGEASDLTLGASLMTGPPDPDAALGCTIAGGDLSLRARATTVRLEYLVRRQSFSPDPLLTFKLPLDPSGQEHFTKHGAYLELEHAASERVTVVARADALYRTGNLPAGSALAPRAAVFRYTAATTIAIQPGFRLKAAVELWSFSNDPPSHEELEPSYHLAIVGTF
jgi:hypothetical protein